MREILTRYGRHNIGFMWVFVEPMLFTSGVLILWTLLHHTTKLPLIPFAVTGYSTVLLWRNTINRCGNAIEPNRSLLHHRNVRVLDLYIGRIILELVGASISFITLSIVLSLTGLMDTPDDVLKMIAAWLMLAWFSASMALFIGSLTVLSETVERVWHVLSYLFLPLSGAFFMVDWLPSHLQDWALLIPTVDCTELLRDGYFGSKVRTHFDIGYVAAVNMVLMLPALFAVRVISEKVEGE